MKIVHNIIPDYAKAYSDICEKYKDKIAFIQRYYPNWQPSFNPICKIKMKIILTIAIMLSSLSGMAQTKQIKKYYKTVVVFQTTNGCYRSAVRTEYFDSSYSANYDEVFAAISKWVKPYKIKLGSFKITSMTRVSKRGMLHKKEKFEPCAFEPVNFSRYSGLSTAVIDTSIRISSMAGYSYRFKTCHTWTGSNKTFLRISDIDSNGTTTVKFLKSEVHFINDSTFTFKQK